MVVHDNTVLSDDPNFQMDQQDTTIEGDTQMIAKQKTVDFEQRNLDKLREMAQRKEDELKRMEEAREKAQRRQEKLKQNVLRDAQLYK